MGTFSTTVTLVAVLIAGGPQANADRIPRVGLTALTHKTGWVAIGQIDSDEWATTNSPEFEILGRKAPPQLTPGPPRRTAILPRIGETIRLIHRLSIIIVDYGVTAEERRLDPPMSSARPGLGKFDETGLWLEPGALLNVEAIEVSPPFGQIREAWARVTLAATKR